MTENNSTPGKSKSVVEYVLTAAGGAADGKSVAAKNKAAARACYDALALVAESVSVSKRLTREMTLAELEPKPRKAVTGAASSTRKSGKR